jgi:co-chaperonin GroES (HSP10)
MQATHRRVIIQRSTTQSTTVSGIILGDAAPEQIWAMIINTGPEVVSDISAGQQVIVDWSTAVPFDHDNQSYYIIDERNILGVQTP